jgi:hypothetical protein
MHELNALPNLQDGKSLALCQRRGQCSAPSSDRSFSLHRKRDPAW